MRCVLLAVALLATQIAAPVRSDCPVRDFLALPLPVSSDNMVTALELAYPGAEADVAGQRFVTPDGTVIRLLPARGLAGQPAFQDATIGDMFTQVYPLAFDLSLREVPWTDPGRIRDDAFFPALYGATEAEVRAHLTEVTYRSPAVTAVFEVTTRNCVHVQLQAALDELAASAPAFDRHFAVVGGGFNWRVIAGTDRMSAHAYGLAVDFNPTLGGYWRWSGREEGNAGAYDNQTPPDLVAVMERHGFIWGGKWHHFDGMHFSYRPDLILFARLAGGD